jgi:hypothetical protein
MPAGYFSGSCAYVGDGFTVVLGVKDFPAASLAKQDFSDRLSVVTGPTYHGPKISMDPGTADGAYWNADHYVAVRGQRTISLTVVHDIKTSRVLMTHDSMRHLVTTALSKGGQ